MSDARPPAEIKARTSFVYPERSRRVPRVSRSWLRRAVRRIWRGLREWSGDAAYETYLRHASKPAAQTPLTPAQFYVEQLNRRYSRPSRCC